MSRRMWLVVAAIAAALAVVAGSIVLFQQTRHSMSTCDTPLLTSAAAPTSGGLRVSEQGFSTLDARVASLGGIVENTSDRVAYRAQITFRLTAADNASAVGEGSGELLRQEIPIIVPGQRVPVGAWTYLRAGPDTNPVAISAMVIEIGAAQWFEPDGFAPITTALRELKRLPTDPNTATITYTLTSPYCEPLFARGMAMVFRDGNGTIIGGSFEADRSPGRCQPGTTTESATAQRSAPHEIDAPRTQSTTYCDVAQGPPIVPGGTIN